MDTAYSKTVTFFDTRDLFNKKSTTKLGRLVVVGSSIISPPDETEKNMSTRDVLDIKA